MLDVSYKRMLGVILLLSSSWVVDIRKWFRRWGVDDLLELSGNAMQYVMIEERLVESLRMKWEDAKRTKLEYYIANVNPECWSQYNARMPIDRSNLISLPI